LKRKCLLEDGLLVVGLKNTRFVKIRLIAGL
jgi:hypothetical protein